MKRSLKNVIILISSILVLLVVSLDFSGKTFAAAPLLTASEESEAENTQQEEAGPEAGPAGETGEPEKADTSPDTAATGDTTTVEPVMPELSENENTVPEPAENENTVPEPAKNEKKPERMLLSIQPVRQKNRNRHQAVRTRLQIKQICLTGSLKQAFQANVQIQEIKPIQERQAMIIRMAGSNPAVPQ